MRKPKPRFPDRLRSDVLWDLVDDQRVHPIIQTQLREIARHIDGERLRSAFFVIRR